jgi:hypothetical protein
MNPSSTLLEDGTLLLFSNISEPSDEAFQRHPLQELAVDTFVPNSARLAGGAGVELSVTEYKEDQQQTQGTKKWNSVVVCTGANACGKVNHLVIFLYFTF